MKREYALKEQKDKIKKKILINEVKTEEIKKMKLEELDKRRERGREKQAKLELVKQQNKIAEQERKESLKRQQEWLD